jgi:hypothetical protein
MGTLLGHEQKVNATFGAIPRVLPLLFICFLPPLEFNSPQLPNPNKGGGGGGGGEEEEEE